MCCDGVRTAIVVRGTRTTPKYQRTSDRRPRYVPSILRTRFLDVCPRSLSISRRPGTRSLALLSLRTNETLDRMRSDDFLPFNITFLRQETRFLTRASRRRSEKNFAAEERRIFLILSIRAVRPARGIRKAIEGIKARANRETSRAEGRHFSASSGTTNSFSHLIKNIIIDCSSRRNSRYHRSRTRRAPRF